MPSSTPVSPLKMALTNAPFLSQQFQDLLDNKLSNFEKEQAIVAIKEYLQNDNLSSWLFDQYLQLINTVETFNDQPLIQRKLRAFLESDSFSHDMFLEIINVLTLIKTAISSNNASAIVEFEQRIKEKQISTPCLTVIEQCLKIFNQSYSSAEFYYLLGYFFQHQYAEPFDQTAMEKYYTQAIKLNHSRAAFNLAQFYEKAAETSKILVEKGEIDSLTKQKITDEVSARKAVLLEDYHLRYSKEIPSLAEGENYDLDMMSYILQRQAALDDIDHQLKIFEKKLTRSEFEKLSDRISELQKLSYEHYQIFNTKINNTQITELLDEIEYIVHTFNADSNAFKKVESLEGFLKKTAGMKNAQAIYLLARLLATKPQPNYSEIIALLKEAFKGGIDFAALKLAEYHQLGRGMPINRPAAIQLIDSAITMKGKGLADALCLRGNIYQLEANYPKAIECYEQSVALKHDAELLTKLGRSYRDGIGIPVDLEKAIEKFRVAKDIDRLYKMLNNYESELSFRGRYMGATFFCLFYKDDKVYGPFKFLKNLLKIDRWQFLSELEADRYSESREKFLFFRYWLSKYDCDFNYELEARYLDTSTKQRVADLIGSYFEAEATKYSPNDILFYKNLQRVPRIAKQRSAACQELSHFLYFNRKSHMGEFKQNCLSYMLEGIQLKNSDCIIFATALISEDITPDCFDNMDDGVSDSLLIKLKMNFAKLYEELDKTTSSFQTPDMLIDSINNHLKCHPRAKIFFESLCKDQQIPSKILLEIYQTIMLLKEATYKNENAADDFEIMLKQAQLSTITLQVVSEFLDCELAAFSLSQTFYLCGLLYEYRYDRPASEEEAIHLYQSAFVASPKAAFKLARIYEKKVQAAKKDLAVLEEKSERDTETINQLIEKHEQASIFYYKSFNVMAFKHDLYQKAVNLHEAAAANKYPRAANVILEKAISIYHQLAESKNAPAMYKLGLIYLYWPHKKPAPEKALFFFQSALKYGDLAASAIQLALIYAKGEIVKQDKDMAIKYLNLAVEKKGENLGFAYCELGKLYEGNKELDKALEYYSLAAKLNYVDKTVSYLNVAMKIFCQNNQTPTVQDIYQNCSHLLNFSNLFSATAFLYSQNLIKKSVFRKLFEQDVKRFTIELASTPILKFNEKIDFLTGRDIFKLSDLSNFINSVSSNKRYSDQDKMAIKNLLSHGQACYEIAKHVLENRFKNPKDFCELFFKSLIEGMKLGNEKCLELAIDLLSPKNDLEKNNFSATFFKYLPELSEKIINLSFEALSPIAKK